MVQLRDFFKRLYSLFFIQRDALNNRLVAVGSVAPAKPSNLLLQMEAYLQAHFEFRFNLVSEETEYREVNACDNVFYPVTQRELNSFCIEARKNGVECWDRDISRYVNSRNIAEFHPFRLYMEELPVWDGTDRLEGLARRVSGDGLWVSGFRRWMLAMVAQWMEMDSLHANSVAPVLISRKQGKQKSTFCKMLLPAALQRYYTDSIDLNSFAQTEQKLTMFGLINLDEFDKIPERKMAVLKNLMQMAGLNIRKAYKKSFRPLPRMASFIATSNQKDLLTDPSGSRRFLCVEIEDKIDCSPINHEQIYAQLKTELLAGERYWFTGKEEAEIMSANASFYKQAMEEELFHACFRPAEAGEDSLSISAAEIFQRLKKYNPSAMRGVSPGRFAKLLMALGVERRHTRYGNLYQVIPVG